MQERHSVVIVDRANKKLIPGDLIPGSVGVLPGGRSKDHDTDFDSQDLRMVVVDRNRFTSDIDIENLSKYPDIISADESCIFDLVEFYAGNVHPSEYIRPDYNVDDYIVGVFNTDCPVVDGIQTTIRLVGGTVRDIDIVSRLSKTEFDYTIKYRVDCDVKYSVEQLREDGMQSDRTYAIKGSKKYFADIDEKDAIEMYLVDVLHDCGGLSNSDRYILFYTLASILIKAEITTLPADGISKITDALLKVSWKIMFNNSYSEGVGNNLGHYESPVKTILDNIFAVIAAILSPDNSNMHKFLKSSQISKIFNSGRIFCDEVGVIPWESICNRMNLSILLDPDICGISQEYFVRMVVNYIEERSNISDGDVVKGNLYILAAQIYSSMVSSLRIGTKVTISRDGVLINRDTKMICNPPEYEALKTVFVIKDILRSDDGEAFVVERLQETDDDTTSPVQYGAIPQHLIIVDDSIGVVDSKIFTIM